VPPKGGEGRRRVVIVGAGFGGLAAARKLRRADVEVTLLDRVNHHLFQPLLYQTAAGCLSSSDCASPIRPAVGRAANTTVLMAEATDLDAERHQLVLEHDERIDYDSLIVACGAETSYFGHDEWQEVTCGLKTLVDAAKLRDRFYSAFERAERTEDAAARQEWLTFVVIGGGPTGVEVERVVAAFSEKLSRKVARYLEELGVTVREQARATAIDDRGVTIDVAEASERIDARTVIWAAGVHAASFTDAVAHATGANADRGGRIEVNPDLTVPGHPEISVIGDVACLEGPGGRPLPGLATVAIQQARHVAKAIRKGQPGASTPFHYLDKGALAVVGRGKAVCAVRGIELSGRPAFFTYLGVHLYYLGGAPGRRLEVLIKWIGARFGERQSALIEGQRASVERRLNA
jgi:NADH:ubiquinone reductase (H+-translocating)